MEKSSARVGIENSETVIARSFDGRPTQVALVSEGSEAVVIKGLTGDSELGLRREWVFRWDEGLFCQLTEAYERSDSEALSELWGQAEPWS